MRTVKNAAMENNQKNIRTGFVSDHPKSRPE
jgi:hypothetical protein